MQADLKHVESNARYEKLAISFETYVEWSSVAILSHVKEMLDSLAFCNWWLKFCSSYVQAIFHTKILVGAVVFWTFNLWFLKWASYQLSHAASPLTYCFLWQIFKFVKKWLKFLRIRLVLNAIKTFKILVKSSSRPKHTHGVLVLSLKQQLWESPKGRYR